MNKYGQRLKELRERKGISQETLANNLNTTRTRIANYEQGIRQPDFEMQEAIADYFNVSIDYLFCRDHTKMDLSKHEKELIMAYRNASPDLQLAVCAVLGVKRDLKSETALLQEA